MITYYKWLGGVSLGLLAAILLLSIFILSGRHTRKSVYFCSGTVLTLLIVVTIISSIIYGEYHP